MVGSRGYGGRGRGGGGQVLGSWGLGVVEV